MCSEIISNTETAPIPECVRLDLNSSLNFPPHIDSPPTWKKSTKSFIPRSCPSSTGVVQKSSHVYTHKEQKPPINYIKAQAYTLSDKIFVRFNFSSAVIFLELWQFKVLQFCLNQPADRHLQTSPNYQNNSRYFKQLYYPK